MIIAGVNIPSFGNREVNVRLRLRDGESNLLAGLLREDERKSLTGFPGAIHVPVLKQLFSGNDESITQTDIIMLLTPHIVRGPDITEADLRPIYIGSQQTFSARRPAAAAARRPEPAAPPRPRQRRQARRRRIGQQTPHGTITVPPGASPVPGTVVVPNPPPPAPTATPFSRRRRRPPRRRPRPCSPRPPHAGAAAAAAGQPADAPPTTSPGSAERR